MRLLLSLRPRLSTELLTALQAYVSAVRAELGAHLQRVILFGSRARGDARPDSDVDVLLLLTDYPEARWLVRKRVVSATHRLTLTHQLVFGSVLARVADYEAETELLYQQVKQEGIVLMDQRIEQLLAMADNALHEATILDQVAKSPRGTVSRAYYAMFYAAKAALLFQQVEVKSHAGLVNQFGLHLILPGLIDDSFNQKLQDAFNTRQEGDYALALSISAEEAKVKVEDARLFVAEMRRFVGAKD